MKGFILGIALVLCFIYRHEVVSFIDQSLVKANSYHAKDFSKFQQDKLDHE